MNFSKLWIIAVKDIGEAMRSRTMYAFIVIMFILTFSYISSYNGRVGSLTSQADINAFSRSFLNSLSYVLPMMYSIFVCSIFANYSVVVDKAKHTIESLMATPISIRQIWVGKSLAVTLPSIAVGIVVSIIAYFFINFAFVIPKTGFFIVPDWQAIVSVFILVPILIFSIVLVVINIQLIISNPRIANLVFTVIFIILIFGVNALGALGISINFFPLIYLGVIAICLLTALILSRFLTTEKVLLSSKM
jgi:ABC-2 type transport system permease protein